MAKLTRRSFLQDTSVTAAAFSVLPGLPAAAATLQSPGAAPHASSSGSMVIHVSDVAKGEMTILVGAREIVLRDPGLVARLTEAARRADSPNQINDHSQTTRLQD